VSGEFPTIKFPTIKFPWPILPWRIPSGEFPPYIYPPLKKMLLFLLSYYFSYSFFIKSFLIFYLNNFEKIIKICLKKNFLEVNIWRGINQGEFSGGISWGNSPGI